MIETVTLLRLVPFLLTAYIALHKGYPRLACALIVAVASVIIGFNVQLTADQRGIIGSIFSLLILLHALRLPPRTPVELYKTDGSADNEAVSGEQ